MAIIGIIAISKNHAIGKDGKLPWHHSADLKFFKETTTGNAVVMGATTWRSIGKALPNRLNIVLSRSGNVDMPADVKLFSGKSEVIAFAKTYDRDIFIIGGAKVYREFGDLIDKWFVTRVPEIVENADTFMPTAFLDDFEVENRKSLTDDLTVEIMRRK